MTDINDKTPMEHDNPIPNVRGTYDCLRQAAGERLRLERVRHHMTQEELANVLGVSSSYISALERGERPLSRSICEKFHQYFQLSYDYLFDGLYVSSAMVNTMLRETEGTAIDYHRRFEVLIGTCNPEELVSCYRMCNSYLSEMRKEKKGSHIYRS